MSRREDLLWLLDVTRASIEETDSEKRAPLIGQMRAIVAELDSLADDGVVERNGLIDFQNALAKRRQSDPKLSGGAARK